MRKTGHYKTIGNTRYFVPDPLPPKNPPLSLSAEANELYADAKYHLGVLNEMTNRIPDMWRFIKAYTIKEALLSSAIEGVHTTLIDVFTQPLLKSAPSKNTQLVVNYTEALDAAVKMIQDENMPIVSRVILTAHKKLLEHGDGDQSDPGSYRKQAVRVGSFVPAPAQDVPQLIAELETFINTDISLPPLIKAGLAHVQFETIHPFLDGNGRIGRLLIVLMLLEANLLSKPLLYVSYYFKKHHLEYYRHLNDAHTNGNFEGWITFFLKAVKESSIDAYKRAVAIEALEKDLITKITKSHSDKAREMRLKALSSLFGTPVTDINEIASLLDVAYNTAHKIVLDFIDLDILQPENIKQKRDKLFKFQSYLDILEQNFE